MYIQSPPGPLSGPSPVRNRRRNPIWRFRRLFFVLGVFALVALSGVFAFVSQVELIEDNFDELIETTYICTAEVTAGCDAETATNELAADGEDREIVEYAEIPPVVIQAVVATEDQSFFEHQGIDPGGLLRAAYQVAKRELTDGTGSLQGGSTITQQYIKLATEDDADDFTRKGREIVRAIQLEQELTEELGSTEAAKAQILERYLNRAYWGRGVYGVQAAARVYFDKDLAEIDLPEAAYLAGLLRNPSRADAIENPAEAARRRSVSLGLMAEQGYITVEQQVAADADPWATLIPPPQAQIGIGDVKGSQYGTQYFVAAVRNDLAELFPEGEYLTDGLRVYTTLDPDLQRLAYQTITTKLDPSNPYMPNGALTAVDDQGRVVAMMGGADWEQTQVNLAMGTEGGGSGFEAGSQMKVFALAEFIDQGYSPDSYYEAPHSIEFPPSADGKCERWNPSGGGSDDKTKPNHRTVWRATTWSSNTVYAQMMFDIGATQMAAMARDLGLESEMLDCPSLVLGSNPTSPLDMAGAFGNIGREGLRLDPILIERIEDADGNVLCWYPEDSCDGGGPQRTGEQVLDPGVARQVIGAIENVVSGGTGQAAQLVLPDETIRPAAGKTGTTQRNQHAWFTGFTCGLTTSVWVGYPGQLDQPTRFMNDKENVDSGLVWPTMAELFGTDEYGDEITGGKIPAELWHDFMMGALPTLPPCDALPTEDPVGSQQVLGLDLLTTLVHCVDPDPALVAAQSTTTSEGEGEGEGETTTTEGGDTTTSTEETTTTTTEQTTTTAADSQTTDTTAAGDDENALGLPPAGWVGGGSGASLGAGASPRSFGLFPLLPLNNKEQPPPTSPPTTDPCIPVDLEGNPISTTIPPPGQTPPATTDQGGNNGGGNNGGGDNGGDDNGGGSDGGGEDAAPPSSTTSTTEKRGRGNGNGRGRP